MSALKSALSQSVIDNGSLVSSSKNKRDANGELTGRAGTVYDVNIKYQTPEGKRPIQKVF